MTGEAERGIMVCGTGVGASIAALVATRVDRGARLAEVAPKVRGEMVAEVGPEGELAVRTDYTFAYAFAPDRPEAVRGPLDVVASSRFQVRYSLRTGSPGVEGLWADASLGTSFMTFTIDPEGRVGWVRIDGRHLAREPTATPAATPSASITCRSRSSRIS